MGDVVKQEAIDQVKRTENEWRDCFTALCLSLLGEFFMSGDTKYFVIQGMYDKLRKMGYTEVELENFQKYMLEVTKRFQTKNSFMG